MGKNGDLFKKIKDNAFLLCEHFMQKDGLNMTEIVGT